MRTRTKVALAALTLVGLIGLTPVLLIGPAFVGLTPPRSGAVAPGVHVVLDGYVSIGVIEDGTGGVVLVDAGNDPSAEALGEALAELGYTLADVRAVCLTHGHPDHTNGLAALPGVRVIGLAAEAPFLSGAERWRGPLPAILGGDDTGIRLTDAVVDGARLQLGGVALEAFAVPGHTAGSAAWRVDGVLFVGDSATFESDGAVRPAPWVFTDDPGQNRASLAALGDRVGSLAIDVVVASHSGPGTAAALASYGG